VEVFEDVVEEVFAVVEVVFPVLDVPFVEEELLDEVPQVPEAG